MCLSFVAGNQTKAREKLQARLKRNGGYLWKVIQDRYPYDGHDWESLYERDPIKWGKWLTSNRTSSFLTRDENYSNEIYLGFHVFLTREDARKKLRERFIHHHYRLVKVRVDPKDLVAVGYFATYSKCNSAVFTHIMYPRDQKPKK